MMDYEQKYKEALEWMKSLYNGLHGATKEEAEKYFPELKESEDERIRKRLIEFFEDWGETKSHCWGKSVNKILAWLEKQGESGTFDVPQTPIKDAVEVTSRMQYINDDMKPIAEFIMGYANWDLHKDEWNQPTLTVPLFRVLDALIQRGKPYGECSQNIEKQGETDGSIKWHSVLKEPEEIRELLCEWNSYDSTWHEVAFYHSDNKTFWNGERQVEHVTKWCYIDELFEKQGEHQPPWSEEDERLRYSCIKHIEEELQEISKDKFGHSEIISDLKEDCRERINWLKSLKERLS